MRKRWIKPVSIGLLGLTASMVIVSLYLKAKEPSYGGHRLSYWFHELPLTFGFGGSLTGVSVNQTDRWGRIYGAQREKACVSIAAILQKSLGDITIPIRNSTISHVLNIQTNHMRQPVWVWRGGSNVEVNPGLLAF
jgi:hypothetical protein